MITPVVTFDESVAKAEQASWKKALLEHLDGSALDVVPADAKNALEATIHVSIAVETGETDNGAAFHVARAKADLGLIRIRTKVESGHAVAKTEKAAREKALRKLAEKVFRALTY